MGERKWRALDHCNDDNKQAEVVQEADQVADMKQVSNEWIIIKDSENVDVHTTDTQVALSLQAAIQVAIAIVISITIGDNDKGNAVVQDLKQFFKSKQSNMLFNEECLVSACHQHALITSLTFVHTRTD